MENRNSICIQNPGADPAEKKKSGFDPDRMYTFLRGYASGADLTETMKALSFARAKHAGQYRKSGEAYIVHPLTMACNAVSLGIRDDNVIAAILLHDVCEDCNVGISELPVSDEIRHSVNLLTFMVMDGESKKIAKNRYYNMILDNRAAVLTKLIDRCHNVSSMAGTFSRDRLQRYIGETRQYVLPLLRKAKSKYPADADILFILKYHITSVVDSIEAAMIAYDSFPG